jgi:hypothetical protein
MRLYLGIGQTSAIENNNLFLFYHSESKTRQQEIHRCLSTESFCVDRLFDRHIRRIDIKVVWITPMRRLRKVLSHFEVTRIIGRRHLFIKWLTWPRIVILMFRSDRSEGTFLSTDEITQWNVIRTVNFVVLVAISIRIVTIIERRFVRIVVTIGIVRFRIRIIGHRTM